MGLTKVLIKATEGSAGQLEAQFNPKDLEEGYSQSWTPTGAHTDDPRQEFKEPQSRTLSCTLYFDTYETKKDVAQVVQPLIKMTRMDADLGRPPLVLFTYGKYVFKGVIESLNMKYTMFLEDGTRCRAEVGLKMKSAEGAEVSAKKPS
jgi:hypothetical protein